MSKRSFRFFQAGGWAVMAGAFFLVFVHRYSVAAVADNLSSRVPMGLGLTGTALGNLASSYFLIYAIMQIPTGLLADSIGPRLSASAGMLVAALGAALAGLAPSYALLVIGRCLVGMGTAVIYVCTLRFQAEWFSLRHFSTMTGLTTVAGNIGAITAATPLALLVLWAGWRGSFLLLGSLSFVACILLFLMVRDTPGDAGVGSTARRTRPEPQGLWRALIAVIRNRSTWLYFLIYFGAGAATFSFNGLWGMPYLMQVYGLTKDLASSRVLFVSLGVVFGGPLWGWVSDRLGRKKPIIALGAAVQTVLWVALLSPWGGKLPLPLLPIVLFLIGLFSIAFVLAFAGTKESNNPRYSGTAISVVNSGGFLGGAIANTLVGMALDAQWVGQAVNGARVYSLAAFHRAFILYPVMVGLAFVAACLLPERKLER